MENGNCEKRVSEAGGSEVFAPVDGRLPAARFGNLDELGLREAVTVLEHRPADHLLHVGARRPLE